MNKISTQTKIKANILKRTDLAIAAAVGLVMAASVFLSTLIINTTRFFLGR